MIEIIKSNVGYFCGYSNDVLFNDLKNGKTHEKNIIDFIKDNIKSEDTCIEVGSHIGSVAITLSKYCKKLYCFEPQHNIYLALCGNLFLNECYNVKPINAAAYHKNAKFSIASKDKRDGWVGDYEKGFHFVKSFGSISIEEKEDGDMIGKKIDDIVTERISFIKTDAEGGDLCALMGAEKTINSSKPSIIFEFHKDNSLKCYNQTWNDYLSFFNKINYNLIKMDESNFIGLPNK
jgi:FkbM family methyltransferase